VQKILATCIFVSFYIRQWNEVNIEGDYETGRSVCPCTLGGDMHSYERF